YLDGIRFVAEQRSTYDELRRNLPAPPGSEIDEIESAFCRKYPDVEPGLLSSMLFFIHDWHHVR
ncbi:MAG: hypothetical protein ABH877_03370, partial [bacterium]